MKFKIQFVNSDKNSFLTVPSKEKYNKFLSENLNRIKAITPLTESVMVTPTLVDTAWKDLRSRARKNYISTDALNAVCDKFCQHDEWDEEQGLDQEAFYKLHDKLIDRMDEFNYELVDAGEYDKMFNLPKAPQTSQDVRMAKMAQKLNSLVGEPDEDDMAFSMEESAKAQKIAKIIKESFKGNNHLSVAKSILKVVK